MTSPSGRRWYTRRSRTVPAIAAGAVITASAVSSAVSPWPPALLIRSVFTRNAAATVREMRPHMPADGWASHGPVRYGAHRDQVFDLFRPDPTGEPRPAVVWIHGGAWISGSRRDVAPYLTMLAAEGYAAIGLDYTVAPEARYPVAVGQLGDALEYVVRNADELGVDPDRIVLAGDSAGAQLASQLAAMVTNPEYAELVGFTPAFDARRLRGVLLNCGVYDLHAMAGATGIIGWGLKSALWSYTGDRDWSSTRAGTEMSTIAFVTEDFPPTYISGGNGDRLTAIQSKPMAARLRQLRVPVTAVFWPDSSEPALPHEYQFHFTVDAEAAHTAFEQTLRFLARATT